MLIMYITYLPVSVLKHDWILDFDCETFLHDKGPGQDAAGSCVERKAAMPGGKEVQPETQI